MHFDERGIEVLTKQLFNQLLQGEMTEHLGAEHGEQTKKRRGYRNGSCKCRPTTRSLELEVPLDRECTFKTELFERYQRNEKALVLALMEEAHQGVATRKVKMITNELCGRRFSRQTVSRLAQKLDGQVQALGRTEAGAPIPLSHC